jgi:hypothetical protein
MHPAVTAFITQIVSGGEKSALLEIEDFFFGKGKRGLSWVCLYWVVGFGEGAVTSNQLWNKQQSCHSSTKVGSANFGVIFALNKPCPLAAPITGL